MTKWQIAIKLLLQIFFNYFLELELERTVGMSKTETSISEIAANVRGFYNTISRGFLSRVFFQVLQSLFRCHDYKQLTASEFGDKYNMKYVFTHQRPSQTNFYSLKVIKLAPVLRLPPTRCTSDFTTILFDRLPLSYRSKCLREYKPLVAIFAVFVGFVVVVEFFGVECLLPVVDWIIFLVDAHFARGAYINFLSTLLPLKSVSMPSWIPSKSCHVGKLKLSCSIGFFNQLPKSSRRNASNNSRLAI